MGLRNPFRFDVDRDDRRRLHGRLLAGRRPRRTRARAGRPRPVDGHRQAGQLRLAVLRHADMPYRDYDFATETSGRGVQLRRAGQRLAAQHRPPGAAAGGAAGGLLLVRPVRGCSRSWATGGIGPMAGPAYDYARRNRSRIKWPRYFDGKPLFYEWTRDYIKAFRLNRGNQVTADRDPSRPASSFDNPMDMEFGPDGALYVLEYGDGFFAENPEAQLARIDFVRGNRTPVPGRRPTPTAGLAPLTVQFSSAGTADPDGDALRYAWDFDADGTVDSTRAEPDVHLHARTASTRRR